MNKFVTILLALFLASCSMLDSKSAEVTFHIPELPEEMQQLEVSGYRVVVTTVNKHNEFTTKGKSFKTSVPVSGITSVLAYPMGSWGTLKPAGFIVHGNLKSHNYMTWDDGFAAECTAFSLASGAGSENFNFTLFKQKLLEKSDGNPWILNRDKIIYALSFGIFNMNYIKKAESHTLNLPFPGTGTWYSGTPGCIQKFEQAGGYINELSITEGENVFVNPTTGEGITIYADRLTWICISGTTGGLSGYW
ncbi:MAG: hypothetical protein J6U56_03895 [Spirochaetia bacterium]|nr:hypothetical protein [Spirochaetia bacterium]